MDLRVVRDLFVTQDSNQKHCAWQSVLSLPLQRIVAWFSTRRQAALYAMHILHMNKWMVPVTHSWDVPSIDLAQRMTECALVCAVYISSVLHVYASMNPLADRQPKHSSDYCRYSRGCGLSGHQKASPSSSRTHQNELILYAPHTNSVVTADLS